MISDGGPNARLIAAAPDLLAVCKFALVDVESRLYILPIKAKLERQMLTTQKERYGAAISKAEGISWCQST